MIGGLTRRRYLLTVTASLLVTAVLLAVCAVLGSEPLDWGRVFDETRGVDATIFWRFRLPRVVLAAVVGAALAMVGVAFQALLRNPLADPYVMGVSGGAAVGGALATAFGAANAAIIGLVPLSAFVGAAAATLLVYRLAIVRQRLFTLNLLLIGVMLNLFCSALIMLIKTVLRPEKTQAMLMWLMGSLAFEDISWEQIGMVTLLVGAGSVLLMRDSPALNRLLLGDDVAQTLGVAARVVRRRVFFAASLIVGGAVSLTGMIGFVGFVVPHMVRLVIGPDHRLLLPVSAMAGAVFLAVTDLLVRLLVNATHHEFPVGVLTALVGGPLFVYLLRRHRKETLI